MDLTGYPARGPETCKSFKLAAFELEAPDLSVTNVKHFLSAMLNALAELCY